ncbi:hypothetical protein Egran_04841 [Elaphomyces granulatus]|uniref:THO complex subunit 2 n=1 Tax=Elaphomyces granulatus TaxID=519963 RepID=A0A232LTH7_9EURO|nr:hypothetical protein Egran_04841 [Elaphomyces granulatus]
MPPGTGGKRKRGDRSWPGDPSNDNQRPSPHRPGNLNLAQHNNQGHYSNQNRDWGEGRGRGGRRPSRGGRLSSGRIPSDGQNFSLPPRDTPPSTTSKETFDPAQMNGAPSTTTAPSPSPASSHAPVLPEPFPSYAYGTVTRDVIESWAAIGKRKVIEHGVAARSKEDLILLASLFQEILRLVLDGRLPPTEGGAVLKEILDDDVAPEDIDKSVGIKPPGAHFDVQSLFLDTLSILTDVDTSNSALRPFVLSTGISPALLRLELETPLLHALGLVRDTFARMGIRKQTNLLYRQSNYNLLREESEGYSKLLTELFTTSNNEPPSSEVVEDTFERVKAMIGAFDLDVGRVLDVTLDVFAAVLVKQYRFFVKFLRASSWWPKADTIRNSEANQIYSGLPKWALPGSPGWLTTDEEREEILQVNEERDREFWDRVRVVGIRAFFEIGRHPIGDDDRRHSITEVYGCQDEEGETRKWIEGTGTAPPKGNRVAAQLLGFKLRFYSSQARSESDVLPDNLIYLAALLIKIGFISLRDLHPHLWRPDESMEALKEEKVKEKADRERAARPGGGINALMTAGALSDDTLPTPRLRDSETRAGTPVKEQDPEKTITSKTDETDSLPEPSDQKVLLLKSLLAIGALPESLFILSRFPWLMDAYPELPKFIHRVIHHCLSKVYSPLRPLAMVEQLREPKHIPSPDQSGVPKGQIRLTEPLPRRVLRWAQLDKEDTNDGTDYRFYWDDWADNTPVCQSVDDVFALCSSFLNISNHKIGQDPSLLTKLARIGKDSLNQDSSDGNKARWKDLCKRLLLPALSLTKANPGVVNEVFELISVFSREARYNMYAEWYFGQTSRLSDIKSAFDLAKMETKDTLKRLSKTNLRPMARALAKIAYANPGIVVNVAISQIESYENLIEVVVECARYFTYLGYDILTWALVNSLGQKGRSRVQEGGLLTSRWLNALATFAGRAFKRYSVMNPTPVLQYVVEQLQHNNSTDLIVLEQMISSMAGIITDTNFNDTQIQAMAGGELLQSQIMLQLLDKRHESKTTSRRLMKSLTDSKLAGQLLIAIAQERATCIFKESESNHELKLLGNIFDEIHRVLAQYLDLLRSNFSVSEFDSFVPGLAVLIGEFGIQPEIAFWISRPSLCQRVADANHSTQADAVVAKRQPPEIASQSKVGDDNGDVVDDGETTDREDPENALGIDKEAEGITEEVNGHPILFASVTENSEPAPWHPVVQGLMEEVRSILPPEVWETVGLPFYVAFWHLSLYDVHVPQKAYEDEIERQKRKVFSIGNDRSDVSVAGTQRKEKEKRQITELQDRLLEENKRHLKSYAQTRARLQKEKDRWFAGMRGKHDALNVAIMEQCLLPRLLLSPVDAFYCFKMIKYLHSSGTPNFRTVGLLDQLFRDQRLTALIFQCTSKEADNLGRFLNEVLRDLTRWHGDRIAYEKEAFGTRKDLPGFAMAVDPEGKPTTFLDYEDFRRLLYKWHRLLASALKTCLNGGEYMHIRNAISVLKAVVGYFPAVNWIGRDMLTCVNALSQNDERDDVKTPAASLIGDLNRREKQWMLPQAFMINESMASEKGKPRASRPESTTPNPMNATTEFKAAASTTINGTSQIEPTSKSEVEDGEIEDAKMVDVSAKPADENEQGLNESDNKLDEPLDKNSQQLDSGLQEAASTSQGEGSGVNDTAVSNETASHATESGQPSEPTSQKVAETELTGSGRPASPTRSRPSSRPPEITRSTNVPQRTEPNRVTTISHPLRPQPNLPLPSRPEPRIYRHGDLRALNRPPMDLHDDRRDHRDRHSEYSRTSRYGEHDRDRPFEATINDTRVHGRLGERLADRDRMEQPREREFPTRTSPDEHFQRSSHRDARQTPRDPEWPDRPGRTALPSQADAYQARSESDRPRDAPPSRPPTQVHPERPDRVQLAENDIQRRGEQSRVERDERRPLPLRTSPPPRADDIRPNRLDRFASDDRRSGMYSQTHSNRHDDFPTGPRVERPSRVGPPDLIERRDSWSGPDINHGRLNQESRYPRTQDSPSDIPSGPKGRNLPARRNVATPQPSAPGTPTTGPPPALPERQPPTGPSGRLGVRGGHDQSFSSTGPPSPAGERPDINSLHFDRLKNPPPTTDSSFGTGRTHPNPSLPPIIPPSGPRGGGHALPSGPSPVTRGPPSGQPFIGERGRGDKRFAALNNMLQQSSGLTDRGGQGTAIRGRGNIRPPTLLNPPSPQGSQPATPTGVSDHGNAPIATQGRADLFTARAAGHPLSDEDNHSLRTGNRRRSEVTDDSTPDPRRSSRYVQNVSNTLDSDRERDRDHRERDRDRRGDEDNVRSSGRRDDRRERPRDYDRERGRRGDGSINNSREEVLDTREISGRRTGPGSREEGTRHRRDRDDNIIDRLGSSGHDSQGRLRPPPSLGGPPPMLPLPQLPGTPLEERRWGGGRGENRDRGQDRNRDRDRDRDREYRESSGSLPRKRGRLGDEGHGHGDVSRGGMRVTSENKRPRRGQ